MTPHKTAIVRRESTIEAANAAWQHHVAQSGYRPGLSVALLEPARQARDAAIAQAWADFHNEMRAHIDASYRQCLAEHAARHAA